MLVLSTKLKQWAITLATERMARARYLKEEYIVNTLRKSVSIYLTCTRKGIKKRKKFQVEWQQSLHASEHTHIQSARLKHSLVHSAMQFVIFFFYPRLFPSHYWMRKYIRASISSSGSPKFKFIAIYIDIHRHALTVSLTTLPTKMKQYLHYRNHKLYFNSFGWKHEAYLVFYPMSAAWNLWQIMIQSDKSFISCYKISSI